MDKACIICKNEGKYKCPTCMVFYCSVQCCKKHREDGCEVWVKDSEEKTLEPTLNNRSKPRYTTADTVPLEKLELLREDENLKQLLCNPHLRDLLVTVNGSNEPEKVMQMAMQEPLFVEFANACLKVVEPPGGE